MSGASRHTADASAGAVGPGTIVGLHHAIKARMAEIAAGFWSFWC